MRPFSDDLPPEHRSRNNQLLWHTLAQIESQIQEVIERFGKKRVAVVMGTSTTGVDKNVPLFKYAAEHNDWSGVTFNQQQQYFSAPADFIVAQYGLQGLSYGISTACTSGARALISACCYLRRSGYSFTFNNRRVWLAFRSIRTAFQSVFSKSRWNKFR